MSVVSCECCSKQIDLDIEDNYSFARDNTYLCEECSNKQSEKDWVDTISSREYHEEEYRCGCL